MTVHEFPKPNPDRAAIAEMANTIANMSALMRDMAILMDARAEASAMALAALTGRVIALEASLARRERDAAPRGFCED
jgi:hypothetical protein